MKIEEKIRKAWLDVLWNFGPGVKLGWLFTRQVDYNLRLFESRELYFIPVACFKWLGCKTKTTDPAP